MSSLSKLRRLRGADRFKSRFESRRDLGAISIRISARSRRLHDVEHVVRDLAHVLVGVRIAPLEQPRSLLLPAGALQRLRALDDENLDNEGMHDKNLDNEVIRACASHTLYCPPSRDVSPPGTAATAWVNEVTAATYFPACARARECRACHV